MSTETLGRGRGVERTLLLATGLALLAAAVIVIALALIKRHHVSTEALEREQAVQAGPRVVVVAAKQSAPTRVLDLQGEVRPFLQTTLYAKIPGYLRDIHVDKGDTVHAGEVIGRIESPETDRQALAARANATNQRRIAQRYSVLASKDFVSVQDAETANASARVATEQYHQVEATRGYEVLRAPFDGVVAARYADPGAFLGANASPVVAITRNERLRVYAYVDQRHATQVRLGDVVKITFPGERTAREARVSRMAGALDPRTRMLLVEADLVNTGELVPGGFVDVALTVKQPPAIEIPADALVVRGEQALAAIVDGEDRVRYRRIDVIDSDGKIALVAKGLNAGDRVAVGIGESVSDGAKVQPIMPKK